jgi:hypothetical protein
MPPVATTLARLVPAGGESVAGHFIPGGVRQLSFGSSLWLIEISSKTRVSIPAWAAARSSSNFRDPEVSASDPQQSLAAFAAEFNAICFKCFIPERWLGDHNYADDRREASQPFNIGPRACIGRK